MVREKRVYFRWMNAYWSATARQWAQLVHATETDQAFDLDAMGVRELKQRPKAGTVLRLRDNRVHQE